MIEKRVIWSRLNIICGDKWVGTTESCATILGILDKLEISDSPTVNSPKLKIKYSTVSRLWVLCFDIDNMTKLRSSWINDDTRETSFVKSESFSFESWTFCNQSIILFCLFEKFESKSWSCSINRFLLIKNNNDELRFKAISDKTFLFSEGPWVTEASFWRVRYRLCLAAKMANFCFLIFVGWGILSLSNKFVRNMKL